MEKKLIGKIVALVIAVAAVGAGQTLTSAHTEYIRGGGRVVATVATPAYQFIDPSFSPYASPSYAAYQDAAELMFAKGITSGCIPPPQPPGFCVDSQVSRGQVAVFIVRAWSLRMWGNTEAFRTNTPVSQNPWFDDVPSIDPWFPYIQKLYELGITSGKAAPPMGHYGRDDNITNFEISVFAVRGRNAVDKSCLGPADASGRNCSIDLSGYLMNYPGAPTDPNWPSAPQFDDVGRDTNPNSIYQFAQQAMMFGAVSRDVPIPGGCPLHNFCSGTPPALRAQMAAHVVRIILGERSF